VSEWLGQTKGSRGGNFGGGRGGMYNNKKTERREDRRGIIGNHRLIEATEPKREEKEKGKKDRLERTSD